MSPNTAVEEVQRKAAEVTPERLALWHDYPWTEAGESILVNAEWHGPRCRVNVTRKYADCNCTLVGAVISIEVEAVIVHRLMVMGADPVGPNDITVGVAESASWVEDQWPDGRWSRAARFELAGLLADCLHHNPAPLWSLRRCTRRTSAGTAGRKSSCRTP